MARAKPGRNNWTFMTIPNCSIKPAAAQGSVAGNALYRHQ